MVQAENKTGIKIEESRKKNENHKKEMSGKKSSPTDDAKHEEKTAYAFTHAHIYIHMHAHV